MDGKRSLFISLVALALGGAAFAFAVTGGSRTIQKDVENELTQLRSNFQNLKAQIPPLWGGWPAMGYMIRVKDGPTIYFTGDTGLMLNWEAIGEYYSPDIVIASNSVLFQNGIDEWVYAVNKMRTPKYVLASHHASFPFYPQTDDEFVEKINSQTQATGIPLGERGKPIEVMGVKIIWTGHAGFIIETPSGSRIGIDPEWSTANAANFPEELKDPANYAADLILISHGHFDHLDIGALKTLMQKTEERTPYLLAVFELSGYLKEQLQEFENRILGINMGPWADKEILEKAFAAELTHLEDVEVAAIFATHSSGVFVR